MQTLGVLSRTPAFGRRALALVALALAACASVGNAPAPVAAAPTVVVGTSSHQVDWSVETLERLQPEDVVWTHRSETHTYRGVALTTLFGDELALRASVDPSRGTWSRVVRIRARDAYQAVFSAGELREGWGPTHVWLVWSQDGAPLSSEDGPFRLVVPTDGGGARCVRQVTEIEVLDIASTEGASISR